ncbi:uncharacterized protein LOC135812836 [Sycon ciliatum]|uniref:uncharacterized protein LOC135812836 n=1 Tax=Sycon ciliatum TaxID=27933 RepID=UPI0031F6DF39
MLAEVEAIVNTRPLTYVPGGEDSLDGVVLTPAHFIANGRSLGIPIPSATLEDIDFAPHRDPAREMLHTWQCQLASLDTFWTIWEKEYLPILRSDTGHCQSRKSIFEPTVHSVVLIKDERVPRGSWRLGKITQLIRSETDGKVRAARVITAAGTTVSRPLSCLYPLEVAPPSIAEELPAEAPPVMDDELPAAAAAAAAPPSTTDAPPTATAEPRARPRRAAAAQATDGILACLLDI